MPNLEGRSALDQVKILKDELTRQRRLNLDLERQLKAYKKASGSKQLEKVQSECEKLQEEKEQLSEDLEKSESIRAKQKELIDSLKRDLLFHKKRMEEKKSTVSNSEHGGLSGPIINIESASNSTRNGAVSNVSKTASQAPAKSIRSGHAGGNKLRVRDDDDAVSRSPS